MSSFHWDGSALLFFFFFFSFWVLIWLVLKFWFEFVFWLRAPSILCFTSVLSLSFFFFYLIPEGIVVKGPGEHFLFRLFLPIWEENICGSGRENFFLDFPLPLFSSYSQTEGNSIFHYIFLLTFSILPKIHPTKHSVNDGRGHMFYLFWLYK